MKSNDKEVLKTERNQWAAALIEALNAAGWEARIAASSPARLRVEFDHPVLRRESLYLDVAGNFPDYYNRIWIGDYGNKKIWRTFGPQVVVAEVAARAEAEARRRTAAVESGVARDQARKQAAEEIGSLEFPHGVNVYLQYEGELRGRYRMGLRFSSMFDSLSLDQVKRLNAVFREIVPEAYATLESRTFVLPGNGMFNAPTREGAAELASQKLNRRVNPSELELYAY